MKKCALLLKFFFILFLAHNQTYSQNPITDNDIVLIIRADDIGFCHAANVAIIRSVNEGITTSVEVMVPCPWFFEAAQMLRDNPQIDVGVHLTLTSEWDNYKWGPITNAPSLVNEHGHFYPRTSDQENPGMGFLECGYDIAEVEQELRAQIELARREIPSVSHLSAHMGAAYCMPDLIAVTDKLSQEYGLPIRFDEFKGPKYDGGWSGKGVDGKEAAGNLAALIEGLTPGVWLVVEHPSLADAEMNAITINGYSGVGADRQAVLDAFTSPKVKKVIEKRGVRLMSYGEYVKLLKK